MSGVFTGGAVGIRIVADSSQAQQEIKRTKDLLGGLAVGIKTLLAAVAFNAVGDVITELAVGFAAFGSQLDLSAKRTGLTTESMSRLNYMMELSQGSTEGLEQAILSMNQALYNSQFSATSGALIALRSLRINLTELFRMNSEQRLFRIMAALSQVKNPLRQQALAGDIFGGSGDDVMKMVREGAPALRAYAEEAKLFGYVMSNEATAGAKTLQRDMIRLQKSLEGLRNTLLEVLGPAIHTFIQWMTAFVVATRIAIKNNPEFIDGLWKFARAFLVVGAAVSAVIIMISFPMIAAVLGLTILLLGLLEATGTVDVGFARMFDTIQAGSMSMREWWETAADEMGLVMFNFYDAVTTVWDSIKDDIDLICAYIIDAWGAAWAKVTGDQRESILEAKKAEIQARQTDRWKSFYNRREENRALVGGMRKEREDSPPAPGQDLVGSFKKAFEATMNQLRGMDKYNPIDIGGNPELNSGIIGVPMANGVRGFFGGQSISEQLGAAYSGINFEDRSIAIQETIADSVSKIETNTRPQSGGML